jgi:integrase
MVLPDVIFSRDALVDHLIGLVTFFYKTGFRVSEITELTWLQVELDKGIVRLEAGTTMNDEGRTQYLDNELKED